MKTDMGVYSEKSQKLIQILSEKYPNVKFTVFETVLLNEFLNHLIAQNTIFVQAEKESSVFIFRFLQEIGIGNLLYKPSRNDFRLYWARDCVIVTDMISEAPLNRSGSHAIRLEKLLVDIYCASMQNSM